ncbi:MAG: hypothetical protein ACQEQD_01690 [Bacillota bacterium]
MKLFQNLNFVFVFLLILYFVPFFIGYFLKKSNDTIKIKGSNIIEQGIADPITIKLENKINNLKKKSETEKNYLSYFSLLFIEKFFINALITRILYGFIFIIPIFLTIWNGFSRGVFILANKNKVLMPIIIEDIIYILAASIGVNFGSQIFDFLLLKSKFNLTISSLIINYLVYLILLLLLLTTFKTIVVIWKRK